MADGTAGHHRIIRDEPDPIDYETSKRMAVDRDPAVRAGLARRQDTRPELLYYLAEDQDLTVRLSVARNPRTPVQADLMLAYDVDEGVRAVLAAKLARLLPDLSPEAQAQIHRRTVRALEALARDQVVHIRRAVAETLKDVACAPPALVNALARDVERKVAEPILRYSLALSDRDLLELVSGAREHWVVRAVAQRQTVSPDVAAAIVEAQDVAATGLLLDNAGAVIPEPALERIADGSAGTAVWRVPLARRPELPPRIAERIAAFADQAVLDVLRKRRDFDPDTASDIATVVQRRLEWAGASNQDETSEARARRLHAEGGLDETAIADALAWGDTAFVKAALILRAGVHPVIIDSILDSQSPKGVTALAWRAGLSMRLAMQLQARAAGIPPRLLLNARDGVDYPLTDEELRWQLEFFGVSDRI